MKTSCILCGLLLVVGLVASSPIVKRAAEDDLSPLNEVSWTNNKYFLLSQQESDLLFLLLVILK